MVDLQTIRRSFVVAIVIAWMSPLTAAGEVPSRWQTRFERIDKQLQAGKWKAARPGAVELADEMAGQITGGDGGRRLMALIVTYRAIAEAGLGQEADAAWSWMIAQNLSPAFSRMQIPEWKTLPSGETPAAFLKRHTLRSAGQAPPGLEISTLSPDDPRLKHPGPLEAAGPEQPMTLVTRWHADSIAFELAVDETGRVVQPVLLTGSLPGKIYRSLEAVRPWRFAPAQVDGKPVAVLHRVDTGSKPSTFGLVAARNTWLRPIHELLLEERWEEAGEAAQQAIDAALVCQEGPPAACRPADLLVMRAVAEAGLGRSEDALWHWHMAHTFRTLQPDSLALYGSAGRWLDDHAPRCHGRNFSTGEDDDCDAIDANRGVDGLQPPRVVTTKPLALPEALWQISSLERLDARLVVGKDGRPREPWLMTGRSPAAGYYALQALRDWRFEPALRDGKPVATLVDVTVPLPSSAPAAAITTWRLQLDATEAMLSAEQWQHALDATQKLTPEIVAGIRDGGSDLLARAVAQQALAEAGLGHEAAAAWHWQMAQNLARQTRYLDLSGYGVAGERLEHYRSQRLDIVESREHRPTAVVRQATEPSYPEYASTLNDFGVFEVLVDETGRPRAPRLLSGHAPGPVYSAMEALRGWTFEPPAGGEPTFQRVQMALSPKAKLAKINAKPEAVTLANMALNEARGGDQVIAGCYWHAAVDLDPAIRRRSEERV